MTVQYCSGSVWTGIVEQEGAEALQWRFSEKKERHGENLNPLKNFNHHQGVLWVMPGEPTYHRSSNTQVVINGHLHHDPSP